MRVVLPPYSHTLIHNFTLVFGTLGQHSATKGIGLHGKHLVNDSEAFWIISWVGSLTSGSQGTEIGSLLHQIHNIHAIDGQYHQNSTEKRRNPLNSTALPSLKSQKFAIIRHMAEASMKGLYTIPDSFSTTAILGDDAPTQLFHGYSDNPREKAGGALLPLWQVQMIGPQILVNIDLGSNAYDDKNHKETIPAWIPPDYIERLNEKIGPAPAVGVQEAAKLGIKWGKIKTLPDLGGVRGDGEGVLWDQKEIPGKGIGVTALKKFDTGDLLFCERPMMIPRTHFVRMKDSTHPDYWKVLYDRLSPSQQLRFKSLHNAKRIVSSAPPTQLGDVAEGIEEGTVRTNMIIFPPFGSGIEFTFGGVFALTSRLNHSCSPNVSWSFVQSNFGLEVRAVRPIKQGEELVASYGCARDQWGERRSYLLEKYQFTCQCQFCSLEGKEREESDKRRARLRAWNQIHPSFEDWHRNPDVFRKDALVKHCEERVSIMYQEGMHAFVSNPLFLLLQAYVAVGDAENASRIGKEAMVSMIATEGSEYDKNLMEDIKRMATRPTTHPIWRMAEKRVQAPPNLEHIQQQLQALFGNFMRLSVKP